MYLAGQRREEGSRSSQSVDTQGIVGTVRIGPLSMVDQSWRQGLQVEVAHAVRANDHGGSLLAEGAHDLLQSIGRTIEVVAVQLDGKPSTAVVVDCLVPTASDA